MFIFEVRLSAVAIVAGTRAQGTFGGVSDYFHFYHYLNYAETSLNSKKEIRKLENGWFQQKACLAEQYAREKNHREFYAILNAIYGPQPRNLHPVRPKSGALLSSAEDIKKRWVEHFNELLNQLTNDDWDILGGIKIYPTLKELDAPITMAEVGTAFNNARARWDFLAEILAHGGSALRSCSPSSIFCEQQKTYHLIGSTPVLVFCSRKEIPVYVEITAGCLCSVSLEKPLPTFLLQRLQYLAESVYPESQSCYRKNRGTVDGNFTLRQIMEKSREQE